MFEKHKKWLEENRETVGMCVAGALGIGVGYLAHAGVAELVKPRGMITTDIYTSKSLERGALEFTQKNLLGQKKVSFSVSWDKDQYLKLAECLLESARKLNGIETVSETVNF